MLRPRSRNGFTLVEVMVASSIMLIVIAAAITIFIMHQRMARSTNTIILGSRTLYTALHEMVYGTSNHQGLREAEEDTVTLAQYNNNDWRLDYDTPSTAGCWVRYQNNRNRIRRNKAQKNDLLTNVDHSTAVLTNSGVLIFIRTLTNEGGAVHTNEATTFIDFRN